MLDEHQYPTLFRQHGYFVCEQVLSAERTDALRLAIERIPGGAEVRRRQQVYGVRNLLEICPAVRELAASSAVRQLVTPLLGNSAFAVRAVFFNKSPGGNWSLRWHQDHAISVRARKDVPGFVGWSNKAGVWQVKPPAEVLADMVAVRVHLDDSNHHNGPLRVLPGSHAHGWLEGRDQWLRLVSATAGAELKSEVVCTVGRGGVVVMCPLLLHASSRSASHAERRVIHIEFAATDLPGGLEWNNQVGPW